MRRSSAPRSWRCAGRAGAGELGQLQQEQAGGIELEVAPAVVGHRRVARVGFELGVDGVEPVEGVLEALHLRGLAQHRVHQAAHQQQYPLLQFEGAPVGAPLAPVGQGQPPHALDRIDAVADPGVAVVAVHRVGGAGRQQTGDRMLALQHHRLDLAVELFQQDPGLPIPVSRIRSPCGDWGTGHLGTRHRLRAADRRRTGPSWQSQGKTKGAPAIDSHSQTHHRWQQPQPTVRDRSRRPAAPPCSACR